MESISPEKIYTREKEHVSWHVSQMILCHQKKKKEIRFTRRKSSFTRKNIYLDMCHRLFCVINQKTKFISPEINLHSREKTFILTCFTDDPVSKKKNFIRKKIYIPEKKHLSWHILLMILCHIKKKNISPEKYLHSREKTVTSICFTDDTVSSNKRQKTFHHKNLHSREKKNIYLEVFDSVSSKKNSFHKNKIFIREEKDLLSHVSPMIICHQKNEKKKFVSPE